MERQNYKRIISLGANSIPRIVSTRQGFKPTLDQGELSLPFDLAVHKYQGICDILESNFEDYCNPDFFKNGVDTYGQPMLRHTKYDMWFAHEIHGAKQQFFTENNYVELIARYQRRINNFRQYIDEGDVLFLALHNEYPHRLNQVIKKAFPTLNYKLVTLNIFIPSEFSVEDFYSKAGYDKEVDYHCLPFPTDDYQWTWWQLESAESEEGRRFENRIGEILSKHMVRTSPIGTSHQSA